jgi:hypothetical protein
MQTIGEAVDNGGFSVIRNGQEIQVPTSKQAKWDIPEVQDRFTNYFFSSVVKYQDLSPPVYKPDSRIRDRWLLDFVPQEPHLHGVEKTACSLVSNRGWGLVGDEQSVLEVRRVVLDADRGEGQRFGQGWRHFIGGLAKAYYNADMGAIAEFGRFPTPDGVIGPLAAMWSTDPARFKLTGDPSQPLKYYPSGRSGDVQDWYDEDFMRVINNPNLNEEYFGLGYCTISVVIEMAKIMIAVYEYDKEKLGAQAPKGLLLLRNISQRQWNQAMDARETKLEGKNLQYYGGLAVLASLGSADIDAKLLALSELPENFDRQEFITLLMYLYSLSFGFSPDEFWPVQIGWLLGRNTEAELGVERATQKGDADFFLAFQDRFQLELPTMGGEDPAVIFKFDERNDRGRMMAADVAHVWAKAAALLYGTSSPDGVTLLTREQTLQVLADQGIIPEEFSASDEATKADDTHAIRARNRARQSPGILRMAEYRPSKPIIHYTYPDDRITVLFERGADILRPAVWAVPELPSGEVQLLHG